MRRCGRRFRTGDDRDTGDGKLLTQHLLLDLLQLRGRVEAELVGERERRRAKAASASPADRPRPAPASARRRRRSRSGSATTSASSAATASRARPAPTAPAACCSSGCGPELGEPSDLGGQRVVVQLRVRAPSPERQRGSQAVPTGRRVYEGCRGGEVVRERRHVDARPVRVQPVAVRSGGEPDSAGQQAAQSGDVGLHGPGRVGRHLVDPHHVRQAGDVDGSPQVRRERGEQPPLTDGADPHRTAVPLEQQRPENPSTTTPPSSQFGQDRRNGGTTRDIAADPPLTGELEMTRFGVMKQVDRQVHRTPGLGAGRPEEARGGRGMTTATSTPTDATAFSRTS